MCAYTEINCLSLFELLFYSLVSKHFLFVALTRISATMNAHLIVLTFCLLGAGKK